ncbi:MAG: phosphate signaling complex protein PhoU [Ignavibacteriae bacterium]|nr:phosphate signaling complex protein PhoU [Ignavibacteria bacterium]MBI3363824.1 phosphate signaling complex protein PhoU [Ignavibacteriota bacterium]
MARHFEQELESLKTTLIKMGSLSEDAIRLSIKSLLERDITLAEKVIQGDERINTLEIEIDNAIIDLLALQQPVAIDLRLILAAQKINNDLERIGDHAVNIAESAVALMKQGIKEPFFEIPEMGELAQHMLRDALDSFIHNDAKLGTSILKHDDEIDELNRKVVREFVERMKADLKSIESGMDLIRVSRNLERVADLSTNIAEEVIFIAQARVVKHHAGDESDSTIH